MLFSDFPFGMSSAPLSLLLFVVFGNLYKIIVNKHVLSY